MMPDGTVQAIPMLHWLLLAGAGWLLMVASFIGWHLEQTPLKGRTNLAAVGREPEPTTEKVRRAA